MNQLIYTSKPIIIDEKVSLFPSVAQNNCIVCLVEGVINAMAKIYD